MRPPDVIIGGIDRPYLRRWHIIPRNRWFNIYLHHFLRSDDDRALHDHPWVSVSVILKGQYRDHMPKGSKIYKRGSIIFRGSRSAHRVELIDGPAWTLFITGPKVREWGFWCPSGWKHWKQFTERGCE